MRVLLAYSDPETLAGYLRSADHEVKELYANDLAVQAAVKFGADAVIYSDSLEPVVPHEEALKALLDAGLRVVLLVRRDSSLVPYAGALGIRDFVFLPSSPAQVLHRLENPASPREAAEMVRGLMVTAGMSNPLSPATLAEADVEPDVAAVGKVAVQDVPGESRREKKTSTDWRVPSFALSGSSGRVKLSESLVMRKVRLKKRSFQLGVWRGSRIRARKKQSGIKRAKKVFTERNVADRRHPAVGLTSFPWA